MPELTIRDAMVLIGSLLILAVIIDAWRRMRQQKRSRVRVKLATDLPESIPDDDLSQYRELPNGGARVVSRDDLLRGVGAMPDGDGQSGDDQVGAPASGGEPGTSESEASQGAADDGGESADTEAVLAGVRASSDEPTNLDWLEDLPEDRAPDGTEDTGELPRQPDTEVIILHVMARDSVGFPGKDILEILLACDLRFGDMSFFHRHEQQAGRGPIQFSVANMLQPGVFDIDNMDAMHTRGLVFFLTLPGPDNMTQAFDYMLETAKTVARNLDGELLDESRSVLTQQAVEHSRQQIRELERRLRVRDA